MCRGVEGAETRPPILGREEDFRHPTCRQAAEHLVLARERATGASGSVFPLTRGRRTTTSRQGDAKAPSLAVV